MGMAEDFSEMFESAMEEAYNNGVLPRELMYAHEASKITKTCHGDLCILKGMLDGFNPEAIPNINDVVLFKHLLSTIVMQASLVSDSAEQLHKKYPDISNQ